MKMKMFNENITYRKNKKKKNYTHNIYMRDNKIKIFTIFDSVQYQCALSKWQAH